MTGGVSTVDYGYLEVSVRKSVGFWTKDFQQARPIRQ